METSTNRLSFKERLSYGVADFGFSLVNGSMASFIIFFYTDVAKINATTVGTLLLLARLLDGVSDIIMGLIVDKTKTKHGKARPWLLWLAIPFGITTALVFTVPPFSEQGRLWYAIITYIFMTVFMLTAINIPYGALNPRITQNQYERSVLNIFRMVFSWSANIIVALVTTRLVVFFGEEAKGWFLTYLFYGIIVAMLSLITFYGTRERVEESNSSTENLTIKQSLKALFTNVPLFWVIMANFVFLMNFGLSAVNVYFAQYILKDVDTVGAIGVTGWLPVILVFFILAPFVKKYGKRNVTFVGTLIAILGQTIMILAGSNFTLVLIGLVVRGMGMAAFAGLGLAMMADTIEYSDWKTGHRIEGLIYSGGSFTIKVGIGLGSAIVGWFLGASGYIQGSAEQSAETIGAINALFLYLPLLLWVLQAVFIYVFNLDKIYPSILEDLKARKNNK